MFGYLDDNTKGYRLTWAILLASTPTTTESATYRQLYNWPRRLNAISTSPPIIVSYTNAGAIPLECHPRVLMLCWSLCSAATLGPLGLPIFSRMPSTCPERCCIGNDLHQAFTQRIFSIIVPEHARWGKNRQGRVHRGFAIRVHVYARVVAFFLF